MSSCDALYWPVTTQPLSGSTLHLTHQPFKAWLSTFRRAWATSLRGEQDSCLLRGKLTLWIWIWVSFQRQSQVLRVRKAHPHIFPVSGGNVQWGYKVAEHFSLLISDLSISHGLLLCCDTELHCSVSFPALHGADVQTSAADRAEHLGTGQEYIQLTPLGGKEQKVTGSHCEVSVSTYDLTSLKKTHNFQ